MPNIKPISELRNYGEVLRDGAVGSPVIPLPLSYTVLIVSHQFDEKNLGPSTKCWIQLKSAS